MEDRKWYNNQILTHILLIFIFPIGLYALWKSRTIAKWWKVTATILVAIIFLPSLGTDSQSSKKEVKIAPETRPLTQSQLDSLEEVKRMAELERRRKSTITARQLFQEYQENEVLADRNYKGKYLYVEGIIDNIGKDILDDIYVVLKTNNLMFGVQCYVDDEEVVAKLRKGVKVTFYGKCDGKLGTVGMKDCRLIVD
ncbi:hypothetical protein [Ekhidna sp.]|uniref:OB-fold protein n=1 Tax=Ekhidna sp. TaxID=2608089 RepID=UPI0032993962